MARSLSIFVALALAGCATADTGRIVTIPASPGPAAGMASVLPLRVGHGTVESVSLVYQATSASAGGTAPAAPGPYRLMLRMDDGSVQSLVQDYRGFLVGDRVRVTADGRIIR